MNKSKVLSEAEHNELVANCYRVKRVPYLEDVLVKRQFIHLSDGTFYCLLEALVGEAYYCGKKGKRRK